ncbi:MAG: hypothetical protein C0619_02820 [Desulfuromonas sp.]|nr:MAG: hypothetical protein C0619_02820 [Desulfuromonas sp.]
MTCNQHCLRFGELAVKMGFITQGQLNAALVKQEEENRLNRHRVIGLILHDEGWLSTAQIEEVLKGIFLQPERPADGSFA